MPEHERDAGPDAEEDISWDEGKCDMGESELADFLSEVEDDD